MPPLGLAHKLLSGRHPDTLAPASDADPDDGQVATWSATLKRWIAADPAAGGVTDHAELEGLDADDHEHYALADKSRPNPWVAAGDLAARSIADLGTRTHSLLAGRDADDHPQYAAIAQDEVISGNWRLDGWYSLNNTPIVGTLLKVNMSKAGINTGINVSEIAPSGAGGVTAIYGFFFANQPSGVTAPKVSGLDFAAMPCLGSGIVTELAGIRARVGQAAFSGTITDMYTFLADVPYTSGGPPSCPRSHGLRIRNQGLSWIDTAFGLLIEPQSGADANYDMWVGAAYDGVPNFRMAPGVPAAGESKMGLNLGGTVKKVMEYDVDTAGVGYRALRVVN